MSNSQNEIRTERRVEDGVLIVEAFEEHEFQGFDGEPTTAEVVKRRVKIEADEDMASKIGHELLAWAAEHSSTGPPGQKPMHQQYAEAEPER